MFIAPLMHCHRMTQISSGQGSSSDISYFPCDKQSTSLGYSHGNSITSRGGLEVSEQDLAELTRVTQSSHT